jgi:hypothetical protein
VTRHAKASFARSNSGAGTAWGVEVTGIRRATANLPGRLLSSFLLAVAIAACLVPASALAGVAHEYEKSFGPDGTDTTKFEAPGAVAVDQGTHEVYVADYGLGKIEKFDQDGVPADFSALGSNEIGGFTLFATEALHQIAVNSTSHDFYVSETGRIQAFQQDGEPAEFTAGPGAGSNEIPTFDFLVCGVAVDGNGAIYMGDYATGVHIFAPSGEEITTLPVSEPCNVAVDSNGNLYVSHYVFGAGGVEKFVPSEFPVITGTTYSSAGIVDPNPAFALTIDPANDDLYAAEHPELEESAIVQYDQSGALLGKFAETGPGALLTSEGVAVDGTTEKVYTSDLAETGDRQVEIWVAPPPVPPSVGSTTVDGITTSSANFEAQVNPNSFETHYRFEYVTQAQFEASGFTGAAETSEVNLGSAGEAQTAHGHAGGLIPDTTYRFRVVAENEHGTSASSEPAPRFTTFAAFPPGLPDGRAYEMVSPAQKTGEVIPPTFVSLTCEECVPGINNTMMPFQSAPDGESVLYLGQPFSAGLAAGPNQYRSARSAGGWVTQSLSTPLFTAGEGYQAFSADLSRGVLFQVQPTLSPEAPVSGGKGYANLYLRGEDGSLQPLVTVAPPQRDPGTPEQFSNKFEVVYAGANAGAASALAFSHVIFEANDALTPADPPNAPAAPTIGAEEKNLYEWVDDGSGGGELRLVNVLPGNGGAATGAVLGSGRLLAVEPFLEAATVDHAISDDGSRVFWSETSTGQTYVRIDGTETKEIDDPGAPGRFLTASADGSKVLLSDGCLYDVDAETCEADLAQGDGAKFQGILGVGEDLSRIYFVDTAALTPPGEENENGEHAEAAKFNLYAWHEGTTSFIAALLPRDNKEITLGTGSPFGGWHASRSNRTAQASADGRYLAFMSQASLTGYDSTLNGGGQCQKISVTSACYEVFEYDAAAEELSCASCNPTGQRPLGSSKLGVIRGFPSLAPFPQLSNLTLDGQGRLFFDSQDALSPYDTNGRTQDVYQWEANGVGDCKRAGGCVRLISSGHSPDDSIFLGSSASGDDVFFITREQLSLADKDEQLDLYDARVGGGIASESETLRSECQGEACQPAALVPNDPTPSSSAFSGPGNVKERGASRRRCPKGKRRVRRRGKARCVKTHRQRAANTNRGGVK